jgi:hypothetical protein
MDILLIRSPNLGPDKPEIIILETTPTAMPDIMQRTETKGGIHGIAPTTIDLYAKSCMGPGWTV